MLFRQRTTQPEHFDDPARTAEEIRAGYAQLARVNRLFRLADPYTRLMSAWLGKSSCRRLSILDLGAGDCWLGREIEAWAQQQGWNWSVTSMDVNAIALQLHPGPARVVASAVALPFVDGAFDVVIASQMTHHLNSEADVALHFREAWRVANRGVFITDMATHGLALWGRLVRGAVCRAGPTNASGWTFVSAAFVAGAGVAGTGAAGGHSKGNGAQLFRCAAHSMRAER